MSNAENMSVLIVDDQKPSRDLLTMVLEELGTRNIHSAEDGASALQVFNDFHLDIVICDWQMPNMSGFELLKHIRSTDPNIPFVMVTGRTDRNSVMAAMTAGVTDYIAKPVSPDKLSAKVVRLADAVHKKQPETSAVTWNKNE